MSLEIASPGRPRMRTAGIVAAGVAIVLIVQDLIGTVGFLLVGYSQFRDSGLDMGQVWLSVAYGLLIVLAFAGGVGVSFWRFAPVTAGLAPTALVVRSLAAAGFGAALVFVVHLGFGLIGPLSGVGSLFGNSFPQLPWGDIWQAAGMALQAGVGAFLRQAPVVVLVVLLVWIWLGRHPSQRVVSVEAAEV